MDEQPVAPDSEAPEHITASLVAKWIDEDQLELLVKNYRAIEHSSVRKKAVELVAAYCKTHPIDPLILLAARETDTPAHLAIVSEIRALDKENLSPAFDLNQMPPDQQREALVVIGELRIEKVFAQLRRCLDAEDPMVRTFAMMACGQYQERWGELLPVFADKLKSDSHAKVQHAAARGLARIGSREALTAFDEAIAGRQHVDARILDLRFLLRREVDEAEGKIKPGKQPSAAVKASKRATKEPRESRLAGISLKQVFVIIIFLAVMIASGVYAHKTWRHYHPQPTRQQVDRMVRQNREAQRGNRGNRRGNRTTPRGADRGTNP
ncbi:HEAT repeat domain-containing protein [Candidatus Sumerlaeota bacterium]